MNSTEYRPLPPYAMVEDCLSELDEIGKRHGYLFTVNRERLVGLFLWFLMSAESGVPDPFAERTIGLNPYLRFTRAFTELLKNCATDERGELLDELEGLMADIASVGFAPIVRRSSRQK